MSIGDPLEPVVSKYPFHFPFLEHSGVMPTAASAEPKPDAKAASTKPKVEVKQA